jgi:hypothetical protein
MFYNDSITSRLICPHCQEPFGKSQEKFQKHLRRLKPRAVLLLQQTILHNDLNDEAFLFICEIVQHAYEHTSHFKFSTTIVVDTRLTSATLCSPASTLFPITPMTFKLSKSGRALNAPQIPLASKNRQNSWSDLSLHGIASFKLIPP